MLKYRGIKWLALFAQLAFGFLAELALVGGKTLNFRFADYPFLERASYDSLYTEDLIRTQLPLHPL